MKHADVILAGIRAGRPLTGPRTIHIDLTHSCNANCITCWDHSPLLTSPKPSAWKSQRIDPELVVALLDDVLSLGGLQSVIFSGMGEPFIHPEIYSLIRAVKSRGLHMTIITNLLSADPEKILAADVDQLLIGIHATTKQTYRDFHPNFRFDEWERLNSLLALFKAEGRCYKHVHVICRTNAEELADMVRLGHHYNAGQITFKSAGLANGTEACAITAIQKERLLSQALPKANRLADELGMVTNLDVLERQLSLSGNATAPIAEVSCFMGYAYARIATDGTVFFCCNTDAVVGSIGKDRPFSKLWNGPSWNDLRRRMLARDFLPSCTQCGKLNQNIKIERAIGRMADIDRHKDDTNAAQTNR